MHRSITRAALLSATLSLLAGPALAHAHLKTTAPAADGTVTTSPTELKLGFSEGVNAKFTGVTVSGPDGKPVATGDTALAPGDDAAIVVPVTGSLAPGRYSVAWHALARDGHKTNGSYGFTIKPRRAARPRGTS